MHIEEANLIHVSRIEGAYQKVHGGIALPQSRRDTRAPIAGLPAPEGSLEADQQPVEARGLGAVAALRGQHAEQPSVLFVLRVRASQVGSDRAGGVRISGRIVGLGSLETHGFLRLLRPRPARVPGECAGERQPPGDAIAVGREIERDLAHHRGRQTDRVGGERLDFVEALVHFPPTPERRQRQELHAEGGEVSRKPSLGSLGRLQLPVVLAEQVIGVGQPVVVARAPAQGAAVGVQPLENRHRLTRTIGVQSVAGELLPHQLRAGNRLGQRTPERVRGGEVAAASRHHTVDLHLLEPSETHAAQAARDTRGRVTLIERGPAVSPRRPDQRQRVRRVQGGGALEVRQCGACLAAAVEDLDAGREREVCVVARRLTRDGQVAQSHVDRLGEHGHDALPEQRERRTRLLRTPQHRLEAVQDSPTHFVGDLRLELNAIVAAVHSARYGEARPARQRQRPHIGRLVARPTESIGSTRPASQHHRARGSDLEHPGQRQPVRDPIGGQTPERVEGAVARVVREGDNQNPPRI